MESGDENLAQWCRESREEIEEFRKAYKVCQTLVAVLDSFPERFRSERHAEVMDKARSRLEELKAEEPMIVLLESITDDIESALSGGKPGPGPEGPGGQSQVQEQSSAASTGESGEGAAGGRGSGSGDSEPVLTPLRD